MTRMAGHKISDDGNRIVCTARPDAPCRTMPDCNTETWGDQGCDGHTPAHPVTPGHDCWAVVWVNEPGDLSYTCLTDPDPDIIPGRAVVLTWQDSDIGITWHYPTRTKEDT